MESLPEVSPESCYFARAALSKFTDGSCLFSSWLDVPE